MRGKLVQLTVIFFLLQFYLKKFDFEFQILGGLEGSFFGRFKKKKLCKFWEILSNSQ